MSITSMQMSSCPVGPSLRESSLQAACAPVAALTSAVQRRRCRGPQRSICICAAVLSPPVLPFQRGAEHLQQWTPDSWRSREAKQQPEYPDAEAIGSIVEELRRMPPLIFAGECRNLQAKLAACSTGEAFWLQGMGYSTARCSQLTGLQARWTKACNTLTTGQHTASTCGSLLPLSHVVQGG